MSAKQALNDKVQGSVVAYLRLLITNLRKIYRVKFVSKSVNICQSYKQKRGCLVHFVRLSAVCWPGAQSARDNQAVACNFAKYSPI